MLLLIQMPNNSSIGAKHLNTQGESATQKAITYSIVADDTTVRLINTPGIGDTSGVKQDHLKSQLI